MQVHGFFSLAAARLGKVAEEWAQMQIQVQTRGCHNELAFIFQHELVNPLPYPGYLLQAVSRCLWGFSERLAWTLRAGLYRL